MDNTKGVLKMQFNITLELSQDQVDYLLEALEIAKSVHLKERNQVRDISQIDANHIAQLNAKTWTLQNIRKQIQNGK